MPAAPLDKRDSVVAAPGAFNGKPYWLALAQCGGIYFKLNVLYTDIAVHARVVKPDPKANADYTKKLNEAIKTATMYFNGAEALPDDRPRRRARRRGADLRSAVARGRRPAQDHRCGACRGDMPVPRFIRPARQAYPKACSERLPPAGVTG